MIARQARIIRTRFPLLLEPPPKQELSKPDQSTIGPESN
jgi:hypothetical protein